MIGSPAPAWRWAASVLPEAAGFGVSSGGCHRSVTVVQLGDYKRLRGLSHIDYD